MLIMDQKVTTQHVLGELDAPRRQVPHPADALPALIRHINALPPTDYKTITLDRPGPHNKPKVHEDPAVTLTSYPGTVRQLVVTGLGRRRPHRDHHQRAPRHRQEPDQPATPAG